jgi:hypothetical protein
VSSPIGRNECDEQIFGCRKRCAKWRRKVFLFPLGTGLEPDARNVNELDQRTVFPAG